MTQTSSSNTPTTKVGDLQASEQKATDFKFIIADDVYQEVMYYVRKSDHEVSGFGNVEYDPQKKLFTVTNCILLKQENTRTSSTIDPIAMGKAMYEQRDNPNGLKWWWHSHVDMNVFWSGNDMNVIRGLGQPSWVTATVFNKKNEMRSAFYQLVHVMGNKHEIFVDQIPTTIERYLKKEDTDKWDKLYAEHVSEKKYYTPTYYSSGYEGYGGGYDYDGYSGTDYDRNWERAFGHAPSRGAKPFSELKRETVEWDHTGWYLTESGSLYNPIKDKGLTSNLQIWEEVQAMDKDDFDALCRLDPEFKSFVGRCLELPSEGVNNG